MSSRYLGLMRWRTPLHLFDEFLNIAGMTGCASGGEVGPNPDADVEWIAGGGECPEQLNHGSLAIPVPQSVVLLINPAPGSLDLHGVRGRLWNCAGMEVDRSTPASHRRTMS